MYNLLRNARVRNSQQCRFDSNLGYSVSWDTDDDFRGYTTYSGSTARLVSNGYYFMVTTDSGCSITTPESSISIDAGTYSLVSVHMRLYPGFGHESPTLGKLGFMTSDDVDWDPNKEVEFSVSPDNSYRTYDIDLSAKEEWVGTITRLRLFPVIDATPGQQIFLRSIKASSKTVFSCASGFDGAVCDKFSSYVHVCPFRGSGGIAVSEQVGSYLTVQAGVNDRLLVNINGYGRQAITLSPGVHTPASDVAKDVESKLNLVGVGGYAFATCTVVDGRFVIEADTPEEGSSVEVSAPDEASAAALLGFYSGHAATPGVAAASRYEPEGAFLVGRDSLDTLYSFGTGALETGGFTITPGRYTVQAGLQSYESVRQDTTLDFKDQTFIDYSNPVTENGVLTFAGFSGTGHTNTELRVYRQLLDGSIQFVGSQSFSIGSDDSINQVFTTSCSIRVRKGDLLGLYSASLHTGRDTKSPDFSYFLYDGSLQDSAEPLRLLGTGFKGAPLFARGSRKTDSAVVVIEFEEPEAIESLFIGGSEVSTPEILQLTKLSGPGYNGGPRVAGYTGYSEAGDKAPEWTGLEAITDGLKLDTNDISPSAYPLWWGTGTQADYNYTEAGITVDLAPGVDVLFDIDRVDVYFASDQNIKHFSLDYPQNTDPLDVTRTWQVVSGQFSEVYVDGLLSPSTRYLYDNPAYISVGNYHEDYVALRYRHISFRFDSISARSIRYRGVLDRTADIVDYTSSTLAEFPIYLSPKIQEIEVYGKSIPYSTMQDNFELQSSFDGEVFLSHTDKEDISSAEMRFTVGYPTKALKLFIRPTTELTVDSIRVDSSASDNAVYTNAGESEHQLLSPLNQDSVTTITIVNTSETTSNYSIGLAAERYSDESLFLWNKLESEDATAESEVGPGGIVYKRPNFQLVPYNIAFKSPAYILDTGFLGNAQCYSSYDSQATWDGIGPVVVNGSLADGLTNESAAYAEHGRVYISIDCGSTYAIDKVSLATMSSSIYDVGWSTTIYFSTTDTADPSLVSGWSTDSSSARWIRISAPAVAPGSSYQEGKRTISHVSVLLDVFAPGNFGRLPWVLESNLTSGVASTSSPSPWAHVSPSEYYCVDLGMFTDVIGVVIGPRGVNGLPCDDPGFLNTYNDLDESGASPYVAFSGTFTSDPSRVRWGEIGSASSGRDRWVLVKREQVDEIAVFSDFSGEVLYNPLYSSTKWWSSVVSPVQVFSEYCTPLDSVGVVYPANSSTSEYLRLSCPLGVDNDLCKRDALSLCLYISDVSQLSQAFGYIKLWKYTSEECTFNSYDKEEDTSSFFVWDIADLYPELVNGWNFLLLPFSAVNQVGDTRFVEDISGSAQSDKRRSRIGGLTVAFKGTGTNTAFRVAVDSLEIKRAYFQDGTGTAGVYLSGDDYLKFPLGAFNHSQGCLEFYITPDWSKDPNCNSCLDPRSHTLFHVSNQYGYSMLAAMTTTGLKVFVSDGSHTAALTDISSVSLVAGERSHFAVVWDFTSTFPSVLELYINGVLSSYYSRESLQGSFDTAGLSDSQLVFGGRGWSGLLSDSVSGFDGVVDNVRLYSYPKRDFFQSTASSVLARDLVLLSTNGSDFFGYGSGLPITVKSISPGSSFSLYLKGTGLSSSQPAASRVAFLDIIRSKSG